MQKFDTPPRSPLPWTSPPDGSSGSPPTVLAWPGITGALVGARKATQVDGWIGGGIGGGGGPVRHA
ncbi:hypothetical protein [Streptomyces sp. cg2]|uniref:hypothetical protein n=1 Tax=Streptomyces sp. cg2 TaxID=3238799 RepID=UPI0034E22A9F